MSSGETMNEEPEVFLKRVMGEIDDEVRRRRAAGDFPPSFERRLDLLFSRFTPVGANEGHFAETLKLADRSAYVDIEVPVRSDMPGVGLVKRILRKLMAWYLNYVVQQITHFTSATMRVLHMVDERLDTLEKESEARRPAPLEDEDLSTVAVDVSAWTELVLEAMEKVEGRILHTECGDGVVVGALSAAGRDVYGVDPRAHLLDTAAAAGLDVRREDPLEHLRAVSDLALGGLVLSGCVDRLPVRFQRELAELAGAKLNPGGTLVIVAASPNWWARSAPVVETDLAPGRPLHPDTWCHLLEQHGFGSLRVVSGPAEGGLQTVPGADPAAQAINSNLERLNETLFGPTTFAVVGIRGS